MREDISMSIHGVEKKALPHMFFTTNMLLHGIEVPTQICQDNTISRPYKDCAAYIQQLLESFAGARSPI